MLSQIFPFDSESFNPIFPFNQDNPLKPGVQSDHAEIAIKADNRVINIWNISNPIYHCYFKYGDNPPFHHTDLFVEKPFVDGVMDISLREKINDQINTIAKRFVKGEVNIQVIVEGYEAFYSELIDKINSLGIEEFKIIRQSNSKGNITGILIDTSKFTIIESGVICSKYLEAEAEKELTTPFAKLEDKSNSKIMVIMGVHVNGCGSQYPKNGLETLAGVIRQIQETLLGNSDIIAVGDYNTPPMHARASVIELLKPEAVLLKAPYPTHVNPKSEAANYDQVVILQHNAEATYEMLPASHLSIASQNLIDSIKENHERVSKKLLMAIGVESFKNSFG